LKIPFNFNSPYKSKNIISFWENWHMSLTNFIKIYVYNPLSLFVGRYFFGLNNVIYKIFIYLPFLITFFIIGLWHGANYTFIIFGLMHGSFIIVNHVWRSITQIYNFSLNKYLSWLITFLCVNFSFVIFRSKNVEIAEKLYLSMLGQTREIINFTFEKVLAFIVFSFLIVLILPNTIQFYNNIKNQKKKSLNLYFYMTIFLSLICLLKLKTPQTFIYIQF